MWNVFNSSVSFFEQIIIYNMRLPLLSLSSQKSFPTYPTATALLQLLLVELHNQKVVFFNGIYAPQENY